MTLSHENPAHFAETDHVIADLIDGDLPSLLAKAISLPYRESPHFPLSPGQREANDKVRREFIERVTTAMTNSFYVGYELGQQPTNPTEGEQ